MRYYLVIGFSLIFISLNAQSSKFSDRDSLISDSKAIPKNLIKTNPFAVIWSQIPGAGEAKVIYERAISPDMSVMAGASYNFLSPVITLLDTGLARTIRTAGYRFSGARIQAAHKFFIIKDIKAPQGIFIGPHISYNTFKLYNVNFPLEYEKWIFFNINLISGFQMIIDNLSLELYVGLGYRNNFRIVRDGRDHEPSFKDFPVDNAYKGTIFDLNSPIKVTFSTNAGFAF